MNYQKTLIGGRLTKDNDLRYTPKGTAVLANTVAVNRRWKDGNGGQQEAVTFYDFKAWGATAEALSNYTVKGSPIFLECRMENESWEDKQTGQKRSRNVFIVERFEFLESAKDANSRGEGRGGDHDGQQATQQQADPKRGQTGFVDGDGASGPMYGEEDDIPF